MDLLVGYESEDGSQSPSPSPEVSTADGAATASPSEEPSAPDVGGVAVAVPSAIELTSALTRDMELNELWKNSHPGKPEFVIDLTEDTCVETILPLYQRTATRKKGGLGSSGSRVGGTGEELRIAGIKKVFAAMKLSPQRYLAGYGWRTWKTILLAAIDYGCTAI